jgi:hypothetical protein
MAQSMDLPRLDILFVEAAPIRKRMAHGVLRAVKDYGLD